MKPSSTLSFSQPQSNKRGFSLVEVVLAIGVLSLAIVALLGLFGPTMGSVKQVVDTNLATAVVSRINTHIHREMTWDEVVNAVTATGTVYYVWRSQEVSSDGVSGQVDFRVGTASQLSSDLSAGRLVGTPMAVTFERSTVNSYDYGSTATQGYVPIFISIYPIEPGLTYASPSNLRGVVEPIFTYTAAKTRSM